MLQEYLCLALLPVVPAWTLEWVLDLVHYLLCLGLLMDVATQFCLDAVGLCPTGEGTVCAVVMLGSWLLLPCGAFPHLLLLPANVVAVPPLPFSISPL